MENVSARKVRKANNWLENFLKRLNLRYIYDKIQMFVI